MSVHVSNEELYTVRDAMRELNRILARIDSGELEKAVLTRGGKMIAAVIPISGLERVGSANGRAAMAREIEEKANTDA